MMNYVVESAKSVVAVIDGKRCDSFDYVEMRRADNNKLIDKICAGDVALLNGLRRSDQESVSIDALRLCNPLVHQLAFVEAIYRECDEENAKHPQRDLMIRVMHIKSRVIDNDEPQFYILNVLVNDRADVLVKRCEQHVNEHDNALFIAMPNPSGTPHTMVVTHVMKSNGKCKKLENFRGIFTTANSQRAQQTLTKKRPFKKVAFVIESDDESDASDKWAKHAYDGTSRENAHELAKIQSEMDRQSLEFEMNEARVREEESALEAAAKAVATEQQREMEAMRADIEAE